MILELEVPAQHVDLVVVGKDDHVVAVLYQSGSCQASKRSDSVGGFPRATLVTMARVVPPRVHPMNAPSDRFGH